MDICKQNGITIKPQTLSNYYPNNHKINDERHWQNCRYQKGNHNPLIEKAQTIERSNKIWTKEQTTIYKILQRKLGIEQHEHH